MLLYTCQHFISCDGKHISAAVSLFFCSDCKIQSTLNHRPVAKRAKMVEDAPMGSFAWQLRMELVFESLCRKIKEINGHTSDSSHLDLLKVILYFLPWEITMRPPFGRVVFFSKHLMQFQDFSFGSHVVYIVFWGKHHCAQNWLAFVFFRWLCSWQRSSTIHCDST